MAETPHSDRIRELEKLVARMQPEVDNLKSTQTTADTRIHELARKQDEVRLLLEKELGQIRLENGRELAALQKENALLREKISSLESGKDKFWSRLWLIVPPILAVILSAFITYFVKR